MHFTPPIPTPPKKQIPISNRFSENDKNFATEKGVPFSVSTPDGSLLRYDPSTGLPERIREDLPSDERDPDRKNDISSEKSFWNSNQDDPHVEDHDLDGVPDAPSRPKENICSH